jgi:transposase
MTEPHPRPVTGPAPRIDYNALRRINPEAARRAVLDYLASTGGRVSATAAAFGISRSVVYDILGRQASGDLRDRSRAPHHSPTRTPPEVEASVITARNRTGYGPKTLAAYLARQGLRIPWPTVRKILQRNRSRIHPRARRAVRPPRARPPSGTPVLDYLRRRGL